MSDQRPDLDQMRAQLEAIREQARSTLTKLDELREQFDAEAVEAVSEDGLIRVRLDAEGKVERIDINDLAMRHGTALAGLIQATVGEAAATYAVKSADMAQALVGDDFDVSAITGRGMSEEMRERARRNLGH